MKFRYPATIAILLALALALAVPASPVHAGGVVSVCDEANLRNALYGGGTVTFTCSGTIALTSPITIAANTTVDGSGQSVTISGNNAVQVFTVNTGVTLSLEWLTIADGNNTITPGGGGVETWGGTVNIDHSTFTGNSAYNGGAVYCRECTLTVSHSTFSDNSGFESMSYGGGISTYEGGAVTVSDSTFSGNSAYTGGAIFTNIGTTLIVSRSTFSSNIATEWGGGAIGTRGTGLVSNSTFHGNITLGEYGSAIANDGPLTVTNSTFSNNVGYGDVAIFNDDGTVLLENSIVVSNSQSGMNCYGSVTDGGGNLSYPDTSCFGINQDPLLGPLQDNGGPTFTMAPGLGSPAIDAAVDAICAMDPVNNLDQRGVVRPQGLHCDIGAVEQAPYTLVLTWPIDIKPGSDVNPVNPTARGNVPVAILTTDDFDARQVDPQTVAFGPSGAGASHEREHVADVDGDGDADLLLHFRVRDTGLACGDEYAWLTGQTYAGEAFQGVDEIKTVGCQQGTRANGL